MYKLFFDKRAVKELEKLPKAQRDKIVVKINNLLPIYLYPIWNNSLPLKWSKLFWLRIWDYRVIYKVTNNKVLISAIWHRRYIYRK